MKLSAFRKIGVMAVFAAAAIAPSTAMADPPPPPGTGYYYFNDGAGTCGYMQQTPYGWQVIMTFPCPREVSGD